MNVFVDESGDAGFKIGKSGGGSSEFFAVATVVVADPISLAMGIEELKRQLGLSSNFEFKFISSNHARRRVFFEELRRHDVSIRGFVVNKRLIADQKEFRSKSFFYSTLLKRALLESRETFVDATLTLDRFMSSKQSMLELSSSLRQALQEPVPNSDGVPVMRIREIRHKDSKLDPLIQVADMVAGAIAAHRRETDTKSLELFKARVQDILDWHGVD